MNKLESKSFQKDEIAFVYQTEPLQAYKKKKTTPKSAVRQVCQKQTAEWGSQYRVYNEAGQCHPPACGLLDLPGNPAMLF